MFKIMEKAESASPKSILNYYFLVALYLKICLEHHLSLEDYLRKSGFALRLLKNIDREKGFKQ